MVLVCRIISTGIMRLMSHAEHTLKPKQSIITVLLFTSFIDIRPVPVEQPPLSMHKSIRFSIAPSNREREREREWESGSPMDEEMFPWAISHNWHYRFLLVTLINCCQGLCSDAAMKCCSESNHEMPFYFLLKDQTRPRCTLALKSPTVNMFIGLHGKNRALVLH